jgi:hypothetical protein
MRPGDLLSFRTRFDGVAKLHCMPQALPTLQFMHGPVTIEKTAFAFRLWRVA